jgi:N-acetylneuraminic acid mutarotase
MSISAISPPTVTSECQNTTNVLLTVILAIVAFTGGSFMHVDAQTSEANSKWNDLPPLPQSIAGQCVGTLGDMLVVAGGSSWTNAPWNGGTKHWSDDVIALAPGSRSWQLIGHLPRPSGYGTAVQTGKNLLCIGGQDATQTFDTVIQLGLDGGKLTVRDLPHLPHPIANASAAVAGGKVYVVGGQHTLNAKDVSKEIWSLDISNPSMFGVWKEEPVSPWQHARILPVVAACGDDLFVASGADLVTDQEGTSHRVNLSDAWLLKAGKKWERLPDSPAPIVGAPSLCDGHGSILVFGGDDGQFTDQVFILKDRHPGFSLKTRLFNLHDSQWSLGPTLPLSLVTTGATLWNSRYVIAGGEPQPGHRSDRVIALSIGN